MKLIIALALAAMGAAPSDGPIMIFGGADHDVFLGCLTCSEVDTKSVWASVGKYSWQNEYGLWSHYGANASPYASHSACNPYSSTPPVLVDQAGNSYGYLSVNEYKSGSVCSVTGPERICQALKVMCADK